ncbi:glycoside hydrolase family 2 protein [Radiobacillus sp. PE A8.2]|uniref:glycoside hydrolase family 2 protein n=1 Tax=Radiobacillus sp. PE A8.2 TaxID=3380349 RepID=UPI00388F0D02
MRKFIDLNKDWIFKKQNEKEVSVNIPHTWNNYDGQDGGNDYFRGECSYQKVFTAPNFDSQSKKVFLQFDGVNASTRVYLNGTEIGQHEGGYSTFRINVTSYLRNENRLEVIVDNSVNDSIYPQMADFTFYGGIYRDVDLLMVSMDHFDLDYYGGPGMKITPTVEGSTGKVDIQTYYDGDGEVQVSILDRDENEIASGTGTELNLSIPDVHLWHGVEDPYLYRAVAKLYVNNSLVDKVESRFGVRTFKMDPKKGFILNGKSYPLRGVSRHQDWRDIGNAIEKTHHDRDMELIREVGANTIRLAHYQHDQYFYDLCDEVGMVVWAEIPYISSHLPNGVENTVSQMKELIIQNYNHPSIVTWGVSNEITISSKDKKSMYYNHFVLNNLCHKLDATRPTTLAAYAMCSVTNPTVHITDVVGYNLYLGWYVPGLWLNDLFIKMFHFLYPNRCLSYSEYGAEGMPNLHSKKGRRGDHTEEYQAKYHEYMLRCFKRHPYLCGTFVWNMFDFAADARDQGGEPGMNHKGLVTFDREVKKDSFYIYKAWWSEEPFVHICGRRYKNRAEKVTTVKVYSNQPVVEIYNNGELIASKRADKVFKFRVPLEDENDIQVLAGKCEDRIHVNKVQKFDKSYKLKKSDSNNWM